MIIIDRQLYYKKKKLEKWLRTPAAIKLPWTLR